MTQFYWHIHHDVLLEVANEPIENRIAYIKSEKPKDEIETRLRLLKPVKGELPKKLIDARKAYVRALKVFDLAQEAYVQAREDYGQERKDYDLAQEAYVQAGEAPDQEWKACKPQVEALHKIECPDCPWDGKTIFPKRGF